MNHQEVFEYYRQNKSNFNYLVIQVYNYYVMRVFEKSNNYQFSGDLYVMDDNFNLIISRNGWNMIESMTYDDRVYYIANSKEHAVRVVKDITLLG
jgi:hypothetical protein